MKYCVVVIEGASDQPYLRIKNRTPLEIARTPAMDSISSKGRMGIVKIIPDDFFPESLIGNMSILGYDPVMYYTGQAAFEAKAIGVEVNPDGYVFCCDLVSSFDGNIIDPRAGQIRTAEAELLLEDLSEHFKNQNIRFKTVKNNHHLIILQKNLSVQTCEPHNLVGKNREEYYPMGEGEEYLIQIMEEAHKVLSGHEVNSVRRDLQENPANDIWIWGGGKIPVLPSFLEKFNLSGGVITASLGVKGLAEISGLKIIDVPGITGSWDTNFTAKQEYALEALKELDFVLIHMSAAAEVSRYSDITQKVRILEKIDEKVIKPLSESISEDIRLMIIGGIGVFASDGVAQATPIPFAIAGKELPGGTGLSFVKKMQIKLISPLKREKSFFHFSWAIKYEKRKTDNFLGNVSSSHWRMSKL